MLTVAHVVPQHTASKVTHPSGNVYVQYDSFVHGDVHDVQWELAATNVPDPPPAFEHSAAVILAVRSVGSPDVAHGCQPLAHASAGAEHGPRSLPHGAPVGGARKLGVPLQVAAQPAIVGNVTRSTNASRVPSAHPMLEIVSTGASTGASHATGAASSRGEK